MNIGAYSLRSLTPAAQRSAAITLGAVAACFLIVFAAIRPTNSRMQSTARQIEDLQLSESLIRTDIANTGRVKTQLTATNAALDVLRASGIIEPLLGSYAMRAKALLDPVAAQTGFRIESVRELAAIPLQSPQPPPEQPYVRQPVEFNGQGSYEQIATFIAQTEKEQPLANLSGLLILCQPQTPEIQKAIITFEWPTKGDKIKPKAEPAVKGKPKKAAK